MEVKPNFCSMESVFSENTIFFVPKYQRSYSWERKNVKQFCDDIKALYDAHKTEGKAGQHFLGGIVSVKCKSEDELDDKVKYQLVDGQQRLSTTVILISRIVNLLEGLQLNGDASETREKRIAKYKGKFVDVVFEENGKDVSFPRMTLSKRDHLYFDDAVRNGVVASSDLKSHLLIKRCCSDIDSWLGDFRGVDDNETLENIDVLFKVFSKSCKILIIKMKDISDAYTLFQVINDRGRSLTAGDLLRASSLGAADETGLEDEQLNELETKWDSITEKGTKSTDDKLIAYYVSNKGKGSSKTSLFEDFNKEFFDDKKNISSRIDDIDKQIKIYDLLSDGRWPYKKSMLTEYQRKKLYNLIVIFKHSHCLPLLMAASNLSEKKFYQLIYFLEKFFFVYRVAMEKRMTPVTKIYYKNIIEMRKDSGVYQVRRFVDELRGVLISKIGKSEIHSYLDEIEYEVGGDNKHLKFILSSIEESWKWLSSERKQGFVGIYKSHDRTMCPDAFAYTLEHIYPRNGEVDPTLNPYMHKLENLTLLSGTDNENEGNKSFPEKVPAYRSSRLNMTISLCENESWDTQSLSDRKDFIRRAVIDLFMFGNLPEEVTAA
ncbi:DUF262 domain-containing protein [Neptunomonas qingdaonensis]|uniref:Uncharacterized conserved protein, contains ParB-like and HNH nuclease domains n=1 Tax=Neptunomonas qingdaonensis TaxID=1045558 RepID=A0A1I2TZB1_9GAMM|nr:DUF262 domain-containing protein [Neptunomonas qingdaonensis]SFG68707.1 Uncharacterized conserved protein, contains ParB-like and HNH nuclease domains [Neptunomonas qingdaonensis]